VSDDYRCHEHQGQDPFSDRDCRSGGCCHLACFLHSASEVLQSLEST
jgi:hypothetical protein